MYKFLIIDDHTFVREGIKKIVTSFDENSLVDCATDGTEGVKKLSLQAYDLVILDISLPDRDGLEVLEYIVEYFKDTRVLVLTMHDESIYARKVLKLGAFGFITKDSEETEFILAIKKILDGRRYVSENLGERLIFQNNKNSGSIESLSKRELQVLRLLAQGVQAKQIASDLSLSVKTINTYRSRILEKLELKCTPELINYALKNKII